MNEEEAAELASALSQLAMLQTGQIAALRTICDALVATVATAFPPLTERLQEHLSGLASLQRAELKPIEAQSFDSLIGSVQANLKLLQGE